jgi:hypothetical protein
MAGNGERPLSESERREQWEAFERSKRMLFGKAGEKGGKPGKG